MLVVVPPHVAISASVSHLADEDRSPVVVRIQTAAPLVSGWPFQPPGGAVASMHTLLY